MVFGLFSIDKPSGPTSHDIVAGVRRGVSEKRVGHAGTLDPMAGGVLIVAVGPATRLVEYLAASQKTYHAKITLGVTTDSYDAEGGVVLRQDVPDDITPDCLEAALHDFRGTIMQVPPVYSAVKVGGKPAHARVRAGQTVKLEARPVTICELDLLRFEKPVVELRVVCSPGTYIRSLAHDLGQRLGCGAMLSGLTRTASGPFRIEDAVPWGTLQAAFASAAWQKHLLPADRALDGTMKVQLDEASLERVRNGRSFARENVVAEVGRAYAPGGKFVAVLKGNPDAGVWQPIKVFAEVLEGS